MRAAACVLTEELAAARLELTLDLGRLRPLLQGRPDSGKTGAKRHKEFLDECLRNPSELVQAAASAALSRFAASYLAQLDPKVGQYLFVAVL